MTDKELSISLREIGRAKGMCDKFYNEWKDNDDIDTIIDRFVPGQDFCVKEDYPSLDFVCKHFRIEDLHRHNIYLNEEVDINTDSSGYYVFLGNCSGRLTATGFVSVRVYVRHESNMNLMALDGARIIATFYEDSSANGVSDEYSKCLINKGKQ